MELPKELGGRFVVGAKLVERPSCVVYRGVDQQLGNRPVAIKIFVDQPGDRKDWIDAFERETAILRAASHPALVPIIAGGCEGGWLYLAMEFIDGTTLRDYLKSRSGPMDAEVAVELMAQLMGGLREIHEKNGYHGHIDSRAVLFKGAELRLAGYYPHIISEMQKGVTTQGRLTVDPAYVSPEQISGESATDGRADIYAASVLLYEMVAGVKPFVAESPMQLAMLRLTKDPESPRKHNPEISPLIDAAIMKGLSRSAAQRFASVAEFVDALTGGKKPLKNPLLAAFGDDVERIGGTETIAVSMSTDAIKHILQAHESKQRSEKIAKIVGDGSLTPADDARSAAPEESESFSVASTVMGMKAQSGGSGNLVVTAGDGRGKKFLLDRQQLMIGSDAGCDIALPGKGIPPRYAIVVKRGEEYFVGPLSGTAVIVNGKPLDGAEERKLARGDVISVGSNELRYVAPGEVFTLQAEVADRVIDRPPSRIPKVVAAVALSLVLICGGLFYFYTQNLAARDRQLRAAADKKRKERVELIDRLRREGEEFLQAGALITPVDANATKRFQQILELDPDDTYAKRRIAEIDERVRSLSELEGRRRQFADRIEKLLTDGDRYLQAGSLISPPGGNAKETFTEVLRLDPQNEKAQNQLKEVNRILADLVGQVSELLSQAKGFIEQRQYIAPPGSNAKELVDRVLRLDPLNAEARGLIIDMAARSLVEGDVAKMRKQPDEMRRAFLTAQSLGIDPAIIKRKLEGIRTIEQATSSVVIVETGGQRPVDSKDSRYLNMSEVEQRISSLTVQNYMDMKEAERRVFEIQRQGSSR